MKRIEIERSLLSQALLNPNSWVAHNEKLRKDLFTGERQAIASHMMRQIADTGKPNKLDLFTTYKDSDELHAITKAESIGLTISEHIESLKEYSLSDSINDLATKTLSNTDYAGARLAKLQSGVEDLIDSIQGVETKEFYLDLAEEKIHRAIEAAKKGGIPDYIQPTICPTLNLFLSGGIQNTDLTIIAARPAMGKTSFMREQAIQSFRQGRAVRIYSYEINAELMYTHIAANIGQVQFGRIKDGTLSVQEQERLFSALQMIRDNEKIEVNYNLPLSQLLMDIRLFAKQYKQYQRQVFIDYLQLIPVEAGRNREQEVARITRSLKNANNDTETPVFLLAQLSRAVESRGGDKRPILSDLRESGAIEQDANNIWFLYRPEYYGFDTDELGDNTKDMIEIIQAKARDGATGTQKMRWIREKALWSPWIDNSLDVVSFSEPKKSGYSWGE